jgi:hypothetical protein
VPRIKKPEPKDPTGAKRQRELRATKPELRAFVTPEQYAEAMALIAGGECANQADVVRQAVREKYVRWMKQKA